MTRRQSPRCASDLRLDRLLAGELSALEADELRAHLAECAACRARRAALESEHRELSGGLPAFAALVAAAPAAAPIARGGALPGARPRWAPRGVWLAAGSLAAAVALWVFSAERLEPGGAAPVASRRAAPDTRTKGGRELQLDWVVRRDGEILAPSSADPLRPGDVLRFGVRARRAGQAAVFSLDGAGQLGVYHDWVTIEAGERLLPGAVELDEVLGDEHLYAMVCERTVPLARVEAALRQDPAQPPPPAGCDVVHHVVRKVAP